MMTATDVVRVLRCLQVAGVEAWLDGGWGIDALLGDQTREHDDLDLVVELGRVKQAVEAVSARFRNR